MESGNNIYNPTPEMMKRSKKGLYVVVTILCVLVVGLSAALVVVLLNKCEPCKEANCGASGASGGSASNGGASGGNNGGAVEPPVMNNEDTIRMNNISRFITAATSFQTNNSGKIPFANDSDLPRFTGAYIDSDCKAENGTTTGCEGGFSDPDGTAYTWAKLTGDAPSGTTVDHKIYYRVGAKCKVGGEGSEESSNKKRDFALMIILSDGSIYCGDNQ